MPTRKNRVVQFPLPIRGLNTVNQFARIEEGFARELTNYLILDGAIQMRPGVQSISYNAALGANSQVRWFDVQTYIDNGAGFDYAILYDGRIVTVAAGTLVGNIGGSTTLTPTTVSHLSLNLLIGCQGPRSQIQPFGLAGPTTAVIVGASIIAGCSHRGRLYYTTGNGVIEYSGLAQIAGAMTGGTTDVSAFLGGQTILRMFSVVAQPGLSTETVFVIFGSGGKVLVYTGDNPGAATWQLIGAFDVTTPISSVGFVEIDSDIWVSGKDYGYWFKSLLSGGVQAAYQNSPTRPIENLWAKLGWTPPAAATSTSFSAYIPELDVIITVPYSYGDSNLNLLASIGTTSYALVYHRKYDAWAAWFSTPIRWPVTSRIDTAQKKTQTYFAGNISEECRLSPNTVAANIAVDQQAGATQARIEATLKTAFFSQYDGMLNILKGVRCWYQNSLNGNLILARSIFDYSDLNSPWGWYTQSSVTAINPNNYFETVTTGAANSAATYTRILGLYGSGGGTSIQITQAKGTTETATQTQKLLALTALIEEGTEFF